MKMFKARLLDAKGFASGGCMYVFALDVEEASEIVARRILSGFIVEEVVTPSSPGVYATHGDEK